LFSPRHLPQKNGTVLAFVFYEAIPEANAPKCQSNWLCRTFAFMS